MATVRRLGWALLGLVLVWQVYDLAYRLILRATGQG